MSGGFVDLRQNQGQTIDESFWPSFTDIMTVVMMIFLIATSILMVKNWELINELKTRIKVEQKISQRLKATTAAQQKTSQELLASQDKRYEISRQLQLSLALERRTSEAVQKTSKEKASLKELLEQAELDLSLMNLQVMHTEKKLSSANMALNALQGKLDLNNKTHQDNMSHYKQEITAIQKSHSLLSNKLEQQQVNYNQQVALAEQQHNSLSDDYNSLEKKYNKLIRPSRSSIGKHVVEVRYEKLLGKDTMQFRSSGDNDYQTLSKKSLHNTLDTLKKKYGKSLYIKIIIPDNSGLSYNDAWAFTLELLNKYDYYYQN